MAVKNAILMPKEQHHEADLIFTSSSSPVEEEAKLNMAVFQKSYERASSIFCYGALLHAVQTSHMYKDSKTFVDMSMKKDPEVILGLFGQFPKSYSEQELLDFIAENFDSNESDLLAWRPIDMVEHPKFIDQITNIEYKTWALALNQVWAELTRVVSPNALNSPQRHSILPRRFPMIVPGGRFRESYYWDTYWIVKGLIACEMQMTSIGVVQNLLDDVENFGFVPNGARIYYLNRSQPPLLSHMVLEVFEATKNREWLEKAIAILDKEYLYWMNPESGKIVQFSDGNVLNRYFANTTLPRPESYAEDIHTAQNGSHPPNFAYLQLATGAETGWDYSSRWLAGVNVNNLSLSDIIATFVIPVDLNALLFRMERNLARMHEFIDESLESIPHSNTQCFKSPIAQQYAEAAERRKNAMNKWLWDPNTFCWRDFRIDTEHQSIRNSISNWVVPAWAGMLEGEDEMKINLFKESLKASGLLQIGGAITSDLTTGQQWDSPNVWPPIMSMLIESMEFISDPQMAMKLVETWLSTSFIAWKKDGSMHEKYNGFELGVNGAGGEYEPQVGFGWTNGIILDLLYKYGGKL